MNLKYRILIDRLEMLTDSRVSTTVHSEKEVTIIFSA